MPLHRSESPSPSLPAAPDRPPARAGRSGDVLAGCIVAVLLVPQSMAYAMLAGAPPVTGLYAATLPLLAYLLLGTSKHLSVGPVSIAALLAFAGVGELAATGGPGYMETMSALALLVGLLLAALGLLRVGRWLEAVHPAVIGGFTSAAAIVICLQQLGPLVGVALPREERALPLLQAFAFELPRLDPVTAAIGLLSLAALYALHRLLPIALGPLVVVTLSAVFVKRFALHDGGTAIVGAIPSGLPSLGLAWPAPETALALLPTALAIVLIAFFESYAVALSVAEKTGDKLNADRELIGLGAANVASAAVGAFPVAGAFSRTAVNYGSGARTKLASGVTVALLLATVAWFTKLLYYMPKAALAAIIVFSVIRLVDVRCLVRRAVGSDGWQAYALRLGTFATTLFVGVAQGLLLGIAASFVLSRLQGKHLPK
ncbi:SulP family inorganic anion transporter [Paenibacillus sp. TRM 82003]|nr:SulP family inorganic anion transporter [Paenibacillus sp. TRM 82003]